MLRVNERLRFYKLVIINITVLTCLLISNIHGQYSINKNQDDNNPIAEKSLEYKIDSVKVLLSRHENLEVPGLAVAVIKDEQIIFKNFYGSANLEFGIPINQNTVFDIASVSKQFTAMAIAMLHNDQKLSIHDDIRKYIPELPDFGYMITIEHLLYHTSGLRDWISLAKLTGRDESDCITNEMIIEMVKRQTELNFPPGSEYSYCNTGYVLLAKIVSIATGLPFPQWMEDNIFQPLGMKNTLFRHAPNDIVTNKANSYEIVKGQYKRITGDVSIYGASSLLTTLDDLIKWVVNFDTGSFGGSNVIDMMLKKGILNDGTELDYSFGLVIRNNLGTQNISHGGAILGFNSYLSRYPDQNLSIILLSNSRNIPTSIIENRIAAIFLEYKESIEESNDNYAQPYRELKDINISKELFSKYEGRYIDSLGRCLILKSVEGRPQREWFGFSSVDLSFKTNTIFFDNDPYSVWQYQMVQDLGNREYNIEVTGMGFSTLFKKVVDYKDLPVDEFKSYCGLYLCNELQIVYEIDIVNNTLTVNQLFNDEVKLEHGWNDRFRGNKWWFREVIFYRDLDNKIAGYKVTPDLGLSRKIDFVKLTK